MGIGLVFEIIGILLMFIFVVMGIAIGIYYIGCYFVHLIRRKKHESYIKRIRLTEGCGTDNKNEKRGA